MNNAYWIKIAEKDCNVIYEYVYMNKKSKTVLIQCVKCFDPNQWYIHLINLTDLDLKYNGIACGNINEIKKRMMIILKNLISKRNELISGILEVLEK